MKKIIFVLMACVAPSLFAQNVETKPTRSFWNSCDVSFSFNGGKGSNDRQVFDSKFQVTYTPVWRLGATAELGHSLLLSKQNGVKHWSEAYKLGGGLKFHVGTFKLDDKSVPFRLDVTATMGSTVGKTSWNYTYYDAGVQLRCLQKRFSYGITAGYRHFNSHNNSMPKFNGIYVGLIF